MSSIRDVYDAMAAGPIASTGLKAYPYVPAMSMWPAAFLMPPKIAYEALDDSLLHFQVDIVILVSAAVAQNQSALLDYMNDEGATSIPLAFHNNPKLGLSDCTAHIHAGRGLTYEEQAGYDGFGALLEARVLLG